MKPGLNRRIAGIMLAGLLMGVFGGCGGGGEAAPAAPPAAPPVVALVAPTITTAPAGLSLVEGEDALFSVDVSGSAPLALQWQRDGSPIAGATDATLSLRRVALTDDVARISVTASNGAGTATSAVAMLRVAARPVAPMLLAPPLAASVTVGQVARLSVVAGGTAPLLYQWQRDGVDLPGANAAELALTGALNLDNTAYTVTVSNAAGRITSNPVRLAVLPAPVAPSITGGPVAARVTEGQSVSFSVVAAGTQPFSYQWLRNGVAITGAVGVNFTLAATTLADNGARLAVQVSNAAGAAISSEAPLVVDRALQVELLAGSIGGSGNLDGKGDQARLSWGGVAYDADGNVWYADASSHVIRKVTPSGVVTTVAGVKDSAGAEDGAADQARFTAPSGLAFALNGDLIIADGSNNTIRRLTMSGQVTTIAGRAGSIGNDDGVGAAARFSFPSSVVVGAQGSIFVADMVNRLIREIQPNGRVSTLAGKESNAIADGVGAAAGFGSPSAIACAVPVPAGCVGALLVADSSANTIRKVGIDEGNATLPKGKVITIAGATAQSGTTDGAPLLARFTYPAGLAVLSASRFLVTDLYNQTLREVDLSVAPGRVTTLAGRARERGWTDGNGANARFANPAQMTARADTGEVVIVDAGNATLRRLAANGDVVTLAGLSPMRGSSDGVGAAARFSSLAATALDSVGNVFVADGCAIRRISPSGSVSIVAGAVDQCGAIDGASTAARFKTIGGLAIDGAGVLYVADSYNYTIRRVSTGGLVSTLAGAAGQHGNVQGAGGVARFTTLKAIAIGPDGNLVVSDSAYGIVLRVTPAGVVSLLAGGASGFADGVGAAAGFVYPHAITVTSANEVFVVDSYRVRRITAAGVVSTVVGGTQGLRDGVAAVAGFDLPGALAAGPDGTVFLAEKRLGLVRRIQPNGDVDTLIGVKGERGVRTGMQPRLSGPEALAYHAASNRLIILETAGVLRATLP